jgi:hypothetical protein
MSHPQAERLVRVVPDRRLLLTAEMKIPARLWLVYWYLLYPVHHAIFTAMLRGLGRVTRGA